jgi:hypothetical protein
MRLRQVAWIWFRRAAGTWIKLACGTGVLEGIKFKELLLVAYELSEGRSVSARLRPWLKGVASIEKGVLGTGSATLYWRSREKLSDDFCGLRVVLKGGLAVWVALALMERL